MADCDDCAVRVASKVSSRRASPTAISRSAHPPVPGSTHGTIYAVEVGFTGGAVSFPNTPGFGSPYTIHVEAPTMTTDLTVYADFLSW